IVPQKPLPLPAVVWMVLRRCSQVERNRRRCAAERDAGYRCNRARLDNATVFHRFLRFLTAKFCHRFSRSNFVRKRINNGGKWWRRFVRFAGAGIATILRIANAAGGGAYAW